MQKIMLLATFFVFAQACGRSEQMHPHSHGSNILQGGGWKVAESPYILPPGSTIAVCNSEGTSVTSHVINAVRIWLDAGGRDERISVRSGCTGTRVIHLNKLTEIEDFYGRAHPLADNIHNIDVAPQWAGHWTANHEIGHVFGFAHIFDNVVSIMNSEANGKYMNGGYLSDYDHAEIKRMLSLPDFRKVNALWQKSAAPAPLPSPSFKKCLGADGKTYYEHLVVTSYKGSTFTCSDGKWIQG